MVSSIADANSYICASIKILIFVLLPTHEFHDRRFVHCYVEGALRAFSSMLFRCRMRDIVSCV